MGFANRETIMHRHLLRIAVLAIAAPLVLGACKDNADPVKPKVTAPSAPPPAV
jgi:hypothetical protein